MESTMNVHNNKQPVEKREIWQENSLD